MSSRAVTAREMQFAYYFLKRIGGNTDNNLLLTAVVAWLRQESGQNYIGNNPLNIRHSPFQSGSRETNGNGSFAIFPNLMAAAYASADLLLSAGHDYRGYWLIIKAAQHGTKTAQQANEQALDFLEAIALSKWDAGHYGLTKKERTVATYNVAHNHLIGVWLTIGGKLPAIKVMPDPPKGGKKNHPKPRTTPPKSLNPPSTTSNYVDPFEARGFYMASRPSSDLGNLPPV